MPLKGKEKKKAVIDDSDSDVNLDDVDISDSDDDNEALGASRKRRVVADSDEEEGNRGPTAGRNGMDEDEDGTEDSEDDEGTDDGELSGDLDDDDYIARKTEGMTNLEKENYLFELSEKKQRADERKQALMQQRQAKAALERQDKRLKKKSATTSSSLSAAAGRRSGRQTESTEQQTRQNALAELMARKNKRRYRDDVDDESVDEDVDEDEDAEYRSSKKKRQQKKQKMGESTDDEGEDEEGEGEGERTDSEDEQAERRKEQRKRDREEERSRKIARAREREEQQMLKQKGTPVHHSDIQNLQIRRTLLERIFQEPWFSEYIEKKFVRISIGRREDGTPAYRCCIVSKVEMDSSVSKLKPYKFGPIGNEKHITAGLICKFGRSERLFPFSGVSNQTISVDEIERWKMEMTNHQLPIYSAEVARELFSKAEKLRKNFVYTPEMVKKIVEEKRRRNVMVAKPTQDRLHYETQMNDAKERGDSAKAEEMERKLKLLNDMTARQKRIKEENEADKKSVNIDKLNLKAKQINQQKIVEFKENDSFARRRTVPVLESADVKIAVAAKEDTNKDTKSGDGNEATSVDPDALLMEEDEEESGGGAEGDIKMKESNGKSQGVNAAILKLKGWQLLHDSHKFILDGDTNTRIRRLLPNMTAAAGTVNRSMQRSNEELRRRALLEKTYAVPPEHSTIIPVSQLRA